MQKADERDGRHAATRRAFRTKAAIVLVLVLATSTTAGLLSAYLSPAVEQDIPTVTPSVALTVEGIPAQAAAGDVFTLVATLRNEANRPVPAVLRFEIRNPEGLDFDEITVYAPCGAEERVSSKTLAYYVGSHGPLLAPNGTSFDAGVRVGTVERLLGEEAHWSVVLREIEGRDPAGYASLIDPGTNASDAIRATESAALKVLAYYEMATPLLKPVTSDPADWILSRPFSDTYVPTGANETAGFLVEINPNAEGSYEFTLWAERPDGFGVPNHPWTCAPL